MSAKTPAYFGQLIVINNKAPYFKGHKARVAYIGTGGVSVYLVDSDFDECIVIKYGEYDDGTES